MKKLPLIIIILWFFAINNAFSQTIRQDSLDAYIGQLMEELELPGLSISIVHKGSTIYSKGFGTREFGKNLPVDNHTLFGIGSISKSFVALTIGILVDEGKLDWDDRVIDYLPYFELYDPYVTAHFTIRDLMTHRSGLHSVSGGTLLISTDFSREQVIKGLKHLKPVSGFRDAPAYQNVMWVVASEIVKVVSGMTWEEFLQKRVFDKLGMTHTTSNVADREASKNLAKPHILDDNFQIVQIEQEKSDNAMPAGFIFSSADEMAIYMKLLLNEGVIGKDTIISKTSLAEIFKPQNHFPSYPAPFHNEFTSYGFGWFLTPKHGHKIIEHSGGIDGATANLMMVEDLDFGVVVMTNAAELAPYVVTHKVLFDFLHDEDYNSKDFLLGLRNQWLEQRKQAKIDTEQSRIEGTKPSLDMPLYAGTYHDKMYGDILINASSEGSLEISFPHSHHLHGKLKHWHYDTFLIDWDDIRVPDGFLTFNFNAERDILGFRIDQNNLRCRFWRIGNKEKTKLIIPMCMSIGALC
ncbi:MAG: serine hydrolase [Bacteroidia bacterium]